MEQIENVPCPKYVQFITRVDAVADKLNRCIQTHSWDIGLTFNFIWRKRNVT